MKPIAITLGDPAGVGPEVAAKVLSQAHSSASNWLVVGPRWALETGAQAAGVAIPDVAVVDIDVPKPPDFRFGAVQAQCGRAGVQAVEWAAHAALGGEISAIVTCPLNKEAIHAAGYVDDLGHQEILGRICNAGWTATMLMTPGLRVAHLSTHKSLIEAAQYVRRDTVLEKLKLVHATVTQWGLNQPKIAVAALNPHGGEGGLLGREEIEELIPAVADAIEIGIDAVGPIPSDSVFNRAIDGEFDVVLALYHDQGHIAIKVHNFHESTTATLGIPIVRTSVDHGTAFDIAGKGIADPRGLVAAIEVAEQIVAGELR